MLAKKLTFIFDFLSPYSYQAWTWVRESDSFFKEKGYQLALCPVVMSKVIKSHGTKGPAEIESKRNFLFKDCLRWASLQKIPFCPPARLPFNSLEALRMSCLPHRQRDYVDFFFRLAWEKGIPLDDDVEVEKSLKAAGFDHLQVREETSSREWRRKLRENTTWAIERGLFGVPVFWLTTIDGELLDWFWGRDSIPHLKLFMEGKDPLDHRAYRQYLHLWP